MLKGPAIEQINSSHKKLDLSYITIFINKIIPDIASRTSKDRISFEAAILDLLHDDHK